MNTETRPEPNRELVILEHVESDPDVTQASLAAKLGVAVGTVNWHIKRLVDKGFIKVKRAQRKKLRYIITPEGIAFRARLTMNYIETSMRLYRRTRAQVRELINEVKLAGYDNVRIDGDGDIADICRLTCLEQDIMVVDYSQSDQYQHLRARNQVPVLEIHGMKVILRMEKGPIRELDQESDWKEEIYGK